MRETWNAAKVGLLVVGMLGLGWFAYRAVEEGVGGPGGYRLYALFEDARGLIPKSRVLIAGIDVGYIRKISLVERQARVDLEITEGIEIHEDGSISRESASILGEAILVIDPGSRDAPLLEPGDRIPTAPGAPSTDEILSSVGRTAESVESIAAQVERVFGTEEGGQLMQQALVNLAEALEAVNRTIRANEQVVGNTLANLEATTNQAGPRIVRILDNVERVTSDLRVLAEASEGELDAQGGAVAGTVASLRRSSDELESVLEDVQEVTGRIARGEGTVGRLTEDETLIDEVEGTVRDIGDFVGPIARLQTIVELRSEWNFLANTLKSYVSLRLQPREDRYYLIQFVNDPRGQTSFTETTIRRSPPGDEEVPIQQETRVTTTDDFRFTVMLAKRVAFATFRFGILESTGGVGTDLHFFRDALEFNVDLFALGEQAVPRLRVRAAYEVVSKLWILAGADDVFDEDADFFLGAQLRFNDEDLKSILPFAGTSTLAGGGA
ncbi:MAG TPA: MlaD family protein [Polyangiaceae bacterium LLY-WYZ-14_1]|nr:MlaD family protein [Polyangiaceae bacterium LLY-WYZ-14_1]